MHIVGFEKDYLNLFYREEKFGKRQLASGISPKL